jgi:hypothetical protein
MDHNTIFTLLPVDNELCSSLGPENTHSLIVGEKNLLSGMGEQLETMFPCY